GRAPGGAGHALVRRDPGRASLGGSSPEGGCDQQPVPGGRFRTGPATGAVDRRRRDGDGEGVAPRGTRRAGGSSQGGPPRQPDVDRVGVRPRGPAARGRSLLRPRQPLRASGGQNARDARARARARVSHRPALGRARGARSGGDSPLLARARSVSGVIDARPTLLLILGPTGSGKSDLAHRVALAAGGEIVSADAFAVYRGFDVGTDKPDASRRAEVKYHLLDSAEPSEPFTAGRWAREALEAVEAIVARGRLPIVCGGTGFYVSALMENLPPADPREAAL